MPKERVPAALKGTLSNRAVAATIVELADVLEVGGTDAFRVRAYRSAARTIEDLAEPIADLAASGGVKELKALPGIGESMAKKILEICSTGTLAKLTQERTRIPRELTDLLGIEGLGPKKLHVLHRELGVENLEDLERALERGEVAELPGFGKKSAEKFLSGIEQFRRRQGRFRAADVEPIALALRDRLLDAPGVERVEIAGSFRRGRETVGDLDLLCIADDPAAAVAAFTSAPLVSETILSGETKTSVRLDFGIQVDLRVVPAASFGAALHYFTGSKEHNVKIRGLAREAGCKINEYGVFRGEERIAGATEEEVFAAIGSVYIPPELREDRGELDAGCRGALPELLVVDDILGDLQMHSTASDGRNTVEEMAHAAKSIGRTYIGITDHSKAVAVANGLDDERMREHAQAIRRVDVPGIRVLASVEVDILRDGSLDLADDTLRDLDVVVASIHSSMHLPKDEMTERITRAVESGLVHIFAHPTGRLVQQRDPYDFDFRTVVEACVKNNVALEINAHPARLDLSDVQARLARDLGAKIVISTDAHSTDDLTLMRYGVQVARRAWLTKGDVLNALPVEEFLRAIAR